MVLTGHCIAGDNAFVENKFMATPVPGVHLSDAQDGYNFYLSQIRITIERAFGILVHRWGILRRPLSMSILKVPALVTCLMKLHNFCIDYDSKRTAGSYRRDEASIRRMARKEKGTAVSLDGNGVPIELSGSGHHFRDEPGGTGRRPVRPPSKKDWPMRKMIKHCIDHDLRRPTIHD